MIDSATYREIHRLRQELAELRDPGAHDGPGHALYLALKNGLEEDLALLGAEPTPTPHKPVIRLSTPIKPKPAVAVQVAEPHPTEVLPALPVEKSMPKALPPQEKLDNLLAILADYSARGLNTSRHRFEIRTHCVRHQLPIPEVAFKKEPVDLPGRKPAKAKALPQKVKESAAEPVAPPAAEGCISKDLEDDAIQAFVIQRGTGPVSKIRALRSLALEILPELEDLDEKVSKEVCDEIYLLTKVLALGGDLMGRRSA